MSIYAVIKVPINEPIQRLSLFYVENLDEAKEYTKIKFETIPNDNFKMKIGDKKKVYLWEIYELPNDFQKPKIKDISSAGLFHQNPMLELLQKVKEKAIKKIL